MPDKGHKEMLNPDKSLHQFSDKAKMIGHKREVDELGDGVTLVVVSLEGSAIIAWDGDKQPRENGCVSDCSLVTIVLATV